MTTDDPLGCHPDCTLPLGDDNAGHPGYRCIGPDAKPLPHLGELLAVEEPAHSVETWIPNDGSDGVAYFEFDESGQATITRECLAQIMERAGFVRVDTPPTGEPR